MTVVLVLVEVVSSSDCTSDVLLVFLAYLSCYPVANCAAR